jgi:DNA-binding NtrC family response regulator
MDPLRVAEACRNVMIVVDDDSAVRNSLKFILEVEGFQVRIFSSAEELLNEDSLQTLATEFCEILIAPKWEDLHEYSQDSDCR